MSNIATTTTTTTQVPTATLVPLPPPEDDTNIDNDSDNDNDNDMRHSSSSRSRSSHGRPYVPTVEEVDRRMARDMQLAEELAAREEEKEMKRRNRRKKHDRRDRGSRRDYDEDRYDANDGFHTDRLNADHMLFVNCRLDGNDIDLLVDTGASSSALSKDMVYSLGLEHKLNKSVFGDAKGVGSTNIVGVLENISMRIGQIEFRVFFMVIDSQMPCCILGLDQMRRFKCLVDLDESCIVFGGRDGVAVPFLPQERAMLVAQNMIESAKISDDQQKARERERRERRGSSFDDYYSDGSYTSDSYESSRGFGGAIKRMFGR
eukprot:CAMPEP_0113496988 /NCGR_PEP_ID=MMETSP0014_2-20120614/30400_1 /TAXON_ID=2857 /ORGANISM="Nitzschia sp." /LENGTH=317 /DNA_ID=CAMNT_0000390917 /DNA_START=416 /DNA_END=1369 /DNA_ORIENTATION=- /assembly_acc=CAM_ASM_000159